MNRRERRRLRKLQEQGREIDAPLLVDMIPQEDLPQPSPGETPDQIKTTRKLFMQLQSYTGPIPPPDLLGHYEQVCPGSADRILKQFEEQSRHRRRMENRVNWSNVVSSATGQVMAFVLFAGAIAGGLYLLYHDKRLEGLGSLVTAVGGAAWVLRKAEVERKRDLAKKREDERKK